MSPSTRPTPIVACLSGDGIGPEVMAEAGRVIEAACDLFGIRIRQVHLPFGGDAIDKYGDPFPGHVRAAVKASDAVLLGAVGGPRWDGAARRPEEGLLGLRKELDTFANLRPVRHRDINLLVVRELTGGLYFGKKSLDEMKERLRMRGFFPPEDTATDYAESADVDFDEDDDDDDGEG